MVMGEWVIRVPAQLSVLRRGARREKGMSQQELAFKAGGTSQGRCLWRPARGLQRSAASIALRPGL